MSVRRVVIGDVKNSTYTRLCISATAWNALWMPAKRRHFADAPGRLCMSPRMCWRDATPPISNHGWPNKIQNSSNQQERGES